jgi:hypothetical protein
MRTKNISKLGKKYKEYGSYYINELGEVYSYKRYHGKSGKYIHLPKPHKLKTKISRDGYEVVTILNKGNRIDTSIHRLMALAFIPIPDKYNGLTVHVDHINNIKNDNRLENLQWLTPHENSTLASKDGLYRTDDGNPKSKNMYLIRNNKIIHKGNSMRCAEYVISNDYPNSKKLTVSRTLRQCANGQKKTAYGYYVQFV